MDLIYFSIVIPLYNKANTISRTINSILNQTYGNYEIIVVDDGSTDDSISVVNDLIQNDSKANIFQKKNGGESSARNYGILNSKYDYVAFLDADDFWEETYLFEMKNLINTFQDKGMYCSKYNYVLYEEKIESKTTELFKNKYSVVNNYFRNSPKNPIATSSSTVVYRPIFKEVGLFNEHITHGPDLDMWLRIALHYPVYYCNLPISNYVKDAIDSVTKKIPKLENTIIFILKSYYCGDLVIDNYLDEIKLNFASLYLLAGHEAYFKEIMKSIKIKSIKSLLYKIPNFKLLFFLNKIYQFKYNNLLK